MQNKITKSMLSSLLWNGTFSLGFPSLITSPLNHFHPQNFISAIPLCSINHLHSMLINSNFTVYFSRTRNTFSIFSRMICYTKLAEKVNICFFHFIRHRNNIYLHGSHPKIWPLLMIWFTASVLFVSQLY